MEKKLQENDLCPNCHEGRLIFVLRDDPDSVYPIGGNFEDSLWCDVCDWEIIIKWKRFCLYQQWFL